MNSKPQKPWLFSFLHSLLVFASSTLNPLNSDQASSSSSAVTVAHKPQNPKLGTPESTQGVSASASDDHPPESQKEDFHADAEARNDLVFASTAAADGIDDQPREPLVSSIANPNQVVTATTSESEGMEAQDNLAVITNSFPSYPPHRSLFISDFSLPSSPSSSSSSSLSPSSLSVSPLSHHYQIRSTSPNTIKHSHNSPKTKPEARVTLRVTSKSKTKAEWWEGGLHVMQIIDKQDIGKHILGLVIPMGMGLVFSTSRLASTTEMHVVAIALSCAFAAIWNGTLLRKTYPEVATLILTSGIALMTFAFYAFVGCFLPLKLKWIPGFCWLATLFPLAIFVTAFFRTKKIPEYGEEIKDPEKGEIYQ